MHQKGGNLVLKIWAINLCMFMDKVGTVVQKLRDRWTDHTKTNQTRRQIISLLRLLRIHKKLFGNWIESCDNYLLPADTIVFGQVVICEGIKVSSITSSVLLRC